MSANLHCHETGRRIELLNEHSETLRVNYFLNRDTADEDRYPIIQIEVEESSGNIGAFNVCSREDCDKVINALTETRNSAFPLP